MTESIQLSFPPQFLADLCDLLDRHGLAVATVDLAATVTGLLRRPGIEDQRSSTSLIYADFLATFNEPQTDLVSGARMAYARSLRHITGRAESGWMNQAEADSS